MTTCAGRVPLLWLTGVLLLWGCAGPRSVASSPVEAAVAPVVGESVPAGAGELAESAEAIPGADSTQPERSQPVPQETVPQETAPQETVPQEPVPQEAAPQQPAAQQPVVQEPETQQPETQQPAPQEPATQQPASAPLVVPKTPEEIRARRDAVAAQGSLDEAMGKRVVAAFDDAAGFLEEAARIDARREELVGEQAKAPGQIDSLRSREVPAVPFSPKLPEGSDADAAKERLRTAEATLAPIRIAATEAVDTVNDLEGRRTELVQRLTEVGQELLSITPKDPGVDPPAELREALQARFQARRKKLLAEQLALQVEQSALPVLLDLAGLQRDRAQQALGAAEQALATLRTQVAEVERAAAIQAEADARAAAAQADPRLQPIHARNLEYAEMRRARTRDDQDPAGRAKAFNEEAKRLQDLLEDLRNTVESAGLTDAIGQLLRGELEQLQGQSQQLEGAEELAPQIARIRAQNFRLARELERLRDLPDALASALPAAQIPADPDEAAVLRQDAERLLIERRTLVESLLDGAREQANDLAGLEVASQSLRTARDELTSYIEELILWVRSQPPIWDSGWSSFWTGVAWWGRPRTWAGVWDGLLDDPLALQLLAAALVLAAGLIWWRRPRIRKALQACGQKSRQLRITSFGPTAKALAWTLVLAIPGPLVLLACSLLVVPDGDGAGLRNTIQPAFLRGALLWFGLAMVRQVTRKDGLADAHFQWQPKVLRRLSGNARWLLWVVVPLALLRRMSMGQTSEDADRVFERCVLTAILLAITVFLRRVLHPRHGVLAPESGRVGLARELIALVGAAVPFTLAVQTVLGYSYTADQLLGRLNGTLLMAGIALLVYALLMRGQLLARRRLSLKAAAERVARLRAQAADTAQPDAEAPPVSADEHVDLAAVNAQTRKLIRVVSVLIVLPTLWFLWVDVLPALNYLQSVELWSSMGVDAEGVAIRDVVTLGSVLFAVLLLVATYVAIRNIPGLLELTVLSKLDMGAGERHAVRTLARYTITGIGVVFAFQAVGIGWSKVQFLVAAVSVGLGFGLQEIFANFVSGLIILFERPVRVGDLVTVAGEDGYITRIQMRATTVTDFDRREIVIPNKEFITASVVNWTLSDPITRIVIPVGVAYGTDPKLVHEKLLQAATKCSKVLEDPAPFTVFLEFGDSTLNFDVRVYMAQRTDWRDVMNDVRNNIANDFKAAGIEIAFPQRDLHIKTVQGFDRILASRQGDAEGAPAGA